MWKALQEGIGDMATSAKSALEEGKRILDDMDNSLELEDNEDAKQSVERTTSGEEMVFSEGEFREGSTIREDVKEKEREIGCSSVVEEMSGGHVSGRFETGTTYYDEKAQSELMGDVSATSFRNPLFPGEAAARIEAKMKLDDPEGPSTPLTPIAIGGDDSVLSPHVKADGADETGNFISLLKERQEEIEMPRKKLTETEGANSKLIRERGEHNATIDGCVTSPQHLESVEDSQMCEKTDIVAALQQTVKLLQGQVAEHQQVNAVNKEQRRMAEHNVENLEMELKQTKAMESMKVKEMELRVEEANNGLGELMDRLDKAKDELFEQRAMNAQKQGEMDDLMAHSGVLKDQVAALNIELRKQRTENDIAAAADVGTRAGRMAHHPPLSEPSEYMVNSTTRSTEDDVFSAVPLHLEIVGAEAKRLQDELDAASLRATTLENVANIYERDLKAAEEQVLQLQREQVDVRAEASRLDKASSHAAEPRPDPCIVDKLAQNVQKLENALQKADVAQVAAFKERDEAQQQLHEIEKLLDETVKDKALSERENMLAIHKAEEELGMLRERQLEIESSAQTQVQQLRATAKKHLEDLENEKCGTAKLILEVEELRNQLEDAVNGKNKLCHDLELHVVERQTEQEHMTAVKKRVIDLAADEKALIMDFERQFQLKGQLQAEVESEAIKVIESPQVKVDQCLVNLEMETARVVLERNGLKIDLDRQKIRADEAEVKNLELCRRQSELENKAEFQKESMRADAEERLAVAQKEFDILLSEKSNQNGIIMHAQTRLQQQLEESNSEIHELKAAAATSTFDANKLKGDVLMLKEQLQMVQNDQASQQGWHVMELQKVMDEKAALERLVVHAQISAEHVHDTTADRIALEAEVERLTDLLVTTKKAKEEENKKEAEEKRELQDQLKAEINAKMVAVAQATTANAAVDALLEQKRNTISAEESKASPTFRTDESSLLSNTASSAFSKRKYPPLSQHMMVGDLEAQDDSQMLLATQDQCDEEGRRLQFVGPVWTRLVATSPQFSALIKSIPPSHLQYAFIVELVFMHVLALWGVFFRHCSSNSSAIGAGTE